MAVEITTIEFYGKNNGFNNDYVIVQYKDNSRFHGSIINGVVQNKGTLKMKNKDYKLEDDSYKLISRNDLSIFYNVRLKISKVIYKEITWYPIIKNYYYSKIDKEISIIYLEKLAKATKGYLLKAIPTKNGLKGKISQGKFSFFIPLKKEGDTRTYIETWEYKTHDPIVKNLITYYKEILHDTLIPRTENFDKSAPISKFLTKYQKSITSELMELQFTNSVYHHYKEGFGILSFTDFNNIAYFPYFSDGKLLSYQRSGVEILYRLSIFEDNKISFLLDSDLKVKVIEYGTIKYFPHNDEYFKAPNVFQFIKIDKIEADAIYATIVTPDGIFKGITKNLNPRRGELVEFNSPLTNIYKNGVLTETKEGQAEGDLYRKILNDKKEVESIKVPITPLPPDLEKPDFTIKYGAKMAIKSETGDVEILGKRTREL